MNDDTSMTADEFERRFGAGLPAEVAPSPSPSGVRVRPDVRVSVSGNRCAPGLGFHVAAPLTNANPSLGHGAAPDHPGTTEDRRMRRRHLDVILYGGLCGLVAVVAERLTGRALTRYLRRQGL